MEEHKLKYSNRILMIPLLFVFLIWCIYFVEIKFGFNFNKYGIKPRNLIGLRGVLFAHFIHGDSKHLFNNSIPILVLLSSLLYFYRDVAIKVVVVGGLLTGLLTWFIARGSYHIGASGIVYLLFSFILFSGIIRKHFRLIALSLIIIFLYGSMVWYVFPIKEGMSWEGHLSGFLVGLFFAVIFRKVGIQKHIHVFSHTEFDDMFDEEGNLIERIDTEQNPD